MFIIKPVTFVPTAHFIVPQCTKNLFVQCQHLKHITGLVRPILAFLLFLSVLRALLMEASWRQWAQGHPANPGRPRARTHFSGQRAFFLRLWSHRMYISGCLQNLCYFFYSRRRTRQSSFLVNFISLPLFSLYICIFPTPTSRAQVA